MVLLIVFLFAILALIILSFTSKRKRNIIIFSLSYFILSILATIQGSRLLEQISLDSVRLINRSAGAVSLAGILLAVAFSVVTEMLKKRDKKNITLIATRFFACFGLVIFIIGQLFTLLSYIEISDRTIPVVTVKENVVVLKNHEYRIDDFIEVENSHGEEFGKVVWNTGNRQDSTGIELCGNRQSFVVREANGELAIDIWIHHSHYSDIETRYIIVKTAEE